MSRFAPQTVVQSLVMASMGIFFAVAIFAFAGVDREALLLPGGVSIGFYASAAYVWIMDPETVIAL